jgi:hypothetical protein
MIKCSKAEVRRLKTALHWKLPPAQRERIQMVLWRTGVPRHGKKKRSPIVIGLTIHLIHLQQLFGTRPVAQGSLCHAAR